MLEIFIPFQIGKKLIINKFDKKFLEILMKNFLLEDIKIIETSLMFGLFLKLKKIDENLIILCNGEFGEDYFLDYDTIKNKNIFSFGTSIYKIENIEKNIGNIEKQIENIMDFLNSDKLLTNSKKEEIRKKINKIFFSLAGILFILYKNKLNLEKNFSELKNYDGLEEYKAQASLILKTTKITEIKLDKNLKKFEKALELYLETLEKIFIKIN